MEDNLIGRGVELMLYGMGVVVVFLTLLVLVTSAMSALVQRHFPPPPESGAGPGVPAVADATLVAVIAAAIHKHRSSRTDRENES